MNKRFRELRKQAAREVSNANQWTNDDEWNELFLAKFAELIVKECQTVVEWAISVDSTIDRVPMLIQEHFGVEE
jgi:hypothetical protein